jgi:integral membrane protein (TIGR01906 family)
VKTARIRVAPVLIGIATAILIVAVVLLPFLTPPSVAFAQGRANATAWTGFTTEQLRTATDAILADLVFGGEFDVEIDGAPVLNAREQGHMGDVRTVFRGLWILAAISIAVLLVAAGRADRAGTWRAVRGGALALTIGVLVVGVVGLVAFDQLFELFHRIFFPAGSYLFDPATERLVQLFPFQFWEETAMVVGIVLIAVALVVAAIAGRRAGRSATTSPARELAAATEPGT